MRVIPLIFSALASTLLFVGVAHADANFSAVAKLSTSEFASLSKDLGAGLAFRSLSSASVNGITGFDVSFDLTTTQIQNKAVFQRANANSDSQLIVPRVSVHKGLPFGLDIGVAAAKVGDATLASVEGRFSLLDANTFSPLPKVMGRLSHTQLLNAETIKHTSNQVEVIVSKGFINVEPYAGVGLISSKTIAKSANLQEKLNQFKTMVGVKVGFGLGGISLYVDRVSDRTTQGLSFSVGF